MAQADDRRDLLVGVREDDDVGQRRVGQALAVAVLLADRARRSRALAEVARERVDHGGDVGGRGRARDRESRAFMADLLGQKRGRSGCGSCAVVHVHACPNLGAAVRASAPPCRD